MCRCVWFWLQEVLVLLVGWLSWQQEFEMRRRCTFIPGICVTQTKLVEVVLWKLCLCVLTDLSLQSCLRTSSEGDKASFNCQRSLHYPCISTWHCVDHPVSPHSTSKATSPAGTGSSPVFPTHHPFAALFPQCQRGSNVSLCRLLVVHVAALASDQPICSCFSTVYYFNDIPFVSLSFTLSLVQNSLKHILRNEPASIFKLERQELGLSRLKWN